MRLAFFTFERRLIFSWVLSCICMTAAVDGSVQAVDVKVEFGESATLKCLLKSPSNLVQVTWKKTVNGSDTKLATYTEELGAKVDKPYENLLNISIPGLNQTAITIYKTGLKDEGCYACVFNVFPEGAKEGRVCLSIFGEVLIEKSHTVRIGDPITLKCFLHNPKLITQVSWEKDGQNIGVYKEGAGTIKPQFQKMVHLSMDSPHESTLTILKSATGDEGEYKCVFNSFPTGSSNGITKLHVHSLASHLQPEMIGLTLTLTSVLLWL